MPAFVALRDFEIVIPWLGTQNRLGNFIPCEIKPGAVVVVVLVVLLAVLMKWSRFGRNVYAVGGNSQSALMLGINVKRTKFYSYLLCGLLSGIAGFVFIMTTGAGNVGNAAWIRNKSNSLEYNRRHAAQRRRGEPAWLANRRTDPSDNQRTDPCGGCPIKLSSDSKRALAVSLHCAAKRRYVVAWQEEIQNCSTALAAAALAEGQEKGRETRVAERALECG